MFNEYRLSPRKAWICRVGGTLFLVAAGLTATAMLIGGVWPEVSTLCTAGYCEVMQGPLEVLPKDVQAQVKASPATRDAFQSYLRRPLVRAGMMGVMATSLVPFAVLLLGVGMALRRLGKRREDALARALPWLRFASIAAIVWAVAKPLTDSLQVMLMYAGTPAGPHWHVVLDLQTIGTGLMLGIAAFATVWALEAGLQAQRDLAEIV